MGNVQCCASGRFPESKPPNKPKNKKKTKGLKGISKESNGVGGGKGNGAVQKVVTMAEDSSERPAPTEAPVQSSPPNTDVPDGGTVRQEENSTQDANVVDFDTNAPRTESMAAARERFFNQVHPKNYLFSS
ncbi:unnamed protein product [Arctia plantaginis]|uniref:Uncharacterized protein n=1 Tax=Arctia plantaginis TaxID=874455 RepID=A0A8S1A2I3_ARCPL|nr:unnamed protein product [Arctia plantaginis]